MDQTAMYKLMKSLLPTLDRHLTKGMNGKVGIVGGSKDYTGAPYYAAVASLKSGSDITHIFCSEEAAIPIKCYSPEFIVHPCLYDMEQLDMWLNAVTSVVVGPGLGRDKETQQAVERVLQRVIDNEKMHFVGDADMLWFLSNAEQKERNVQMLWKIGKRAVITPNVVEFGRLAGAWMGEMGEYDIKKQQQIEEVFYSEREGHFGEVDSEHEVVRHVAMLSKSLGNVIVCKKGLVDLISDGTTSYFVAVEGASKRCGGQGDLMSGILGTFSKYAQNIHNPNNALLAVVAASIATRSCAKAAFLKKWIGLTTPDILEEIPGFLAGFYTDDMSKL
ncbi:hypothetical protein FGO68_gene11211 [Halteria grandinella]|uniref:ATP-dependent (S)-NAD(P)H-hydrate dehydratase n=1 Tax=Halteria grandinella TaxID=5974 RepID=A0A8J8NKH5_HALGN|nr:hypothetical protein FGO68_gene11211 [Halteria grandinella]